MTLSDGRTVSGILDTQTRDRITIRTSEGVLTFLAGQVTRVEEEDRSANSFYTLQLAVGRGDYLTALQIRDGMSSDSAWGKRADEEILRAGQQILDRARSAPAVEGAEFAARLRARGDQLPASLRILLARYFAARGDSADATAELIRLPDSGRRDPYARALASSLLRAQLQRSLEKQDPDVAIDAISSLGELVSDDSTSAAMPLLYLNEVSRRTRQQDFGGALAILAQNVVPSTPGVAAEEISRILDVAEKTTSGPTLIALYPIAEQSLNASGMRNDLINTYERHANALAQAGRFDDADRVAAAESILNPDLGARVTHRIELARRRSSIKSDDALAHYKLGIWAREMGLEDDAIAEMQVATRAPQLQENANLQIRLIKLNREKAGYEVAAKLFNDRQFPQAAAAAEKFRRAYPESEFASKAATLIELAKYSQQRDKDMRPAEAEAIYQNAERLYFQDKQDDAFDLVNKLEAEYGETAAGKKAHALRERIRQRAKKLGQPEPQPRIAVPVNSAPADRRARSLSELERLMRVLR